MKSTRVDSICAILMYAGPSSSAICVCVCARVLLVTSYLLPTPESSTSKVWQHRQLASHSQLANHNGNGNDRRADVEAFHADAAMQWLEGTIIHNSIHPPSSKLTAQNSDGFSNMEKYSCSLIFDFDTWIHFRMATQLFFHQRWSDSVRS